VKGASSSPVRRRTSRALGANVTELRAAVDRLVAITGRSKMRRYTADFVRDSLALALDPKPGDAYPI
jgi:hypothetical protein